MPITLVKTLQGIEYTLYSVTNVQTVLETVILVRPNIYQSYGHFLDNFLPIISRQDVLEDSVLLIAVWPYYLQRDYGTVKSLIETFLVNSVAYYSGGIIS